MLTGEKGAGQAGDSSSFTPPPPPSSTGRPRGPEASFGAGGTGRAALCLPSLLLVCLPLLGSASHTAGWALQRVPSLVLSSDLRSQGSELGET